MAHFFVCQLYVWSQRSVEWSSLQWPPCISKFYGVVFQVDYFYQSKVFKHIFMSPSSVDQEPKATHSGNARIHGMRSTTKTSLAYVATQVSKGKLFRVSLTFFQVCFALTSAQVFSRTDLITDSECFYNSILEWLDDPEEKGEVNQLMIWWNRWVTCEMIVSLLMKT